MTNFKDFLVLTEEFNPFFDPVRGYHITDMLIIHNLVEKYNIKKLNVTLNPSI